MYVDHPSKLIVSGSLAQFDSDVSTDRFRELGGESVAELFRKVFVDLEFGSFIDFLKEVMPLYNTTAQDPDSSNRGIQNLEVAEHVLWVSMLGWTCEVMLRR